MNWKRAVIRGLAGTASFVRRNRASCAGLRALLYHSEKGLIETNCRSYKFIILAILGYSQNMLVL
tara:strand:- start:183 stop:377 length:195 start_codon:yes stop_codon:yes gene_type:complete